MEDRITKHPREECYRMAARAADSALGLAARVDLMLWPTAAELLVHAADVVLDELDRRFDGRFCSTHSGWLFKDAMERSGLSGQAFSALPEPQQDGVRHTLSEMVYEELPDPDLEPDDLIVITAQNCGAAIAEREREDAEAAALEEGMAESVTAVLRQYRHNARALGGAAADDWAKSQIAEEASRLVPDVDGERSPLWHRVHDEIRRLFHRYMIHLDDGEPMSDGEYEVRIRGWNSWVPARIERDGRTWKLPIGRVSADGIDSTVAAIRPAV